jgi:hypothetical protein
MDRQKSNYCTEKKTNVGTKETYEGKGSRGDGSQAKARWPSAGSSARGGRGSPVTLIWKEQNSRIKISTETEGARLADVELNGDNMNQGGDQGNSYFSNGKC